MRRTYHCLLFFMCVEAVVIVMLYFGMVQKMLVCSFAFHYPKIPPSITGLTNQTSTQTSSQTSAKKLNGITGDHDKHLNHQLRNKTAIIIPHRNREQHLKELLRNLHPFLQRQQLSYTIYVIHQAGNYEFNRAKLMNVGFKEAMKEEDWNCLFFHDVDLIPQDDRNLYICDRFPKHVSVAIDKFGYRLPYRASFGGVSALTPEQFLKINGFPNNYWGWGGEDDDISTRIVLSGMSISRPLPTYGRFKMIKHRHKLAEENPKRYQLLKKTRMTWKKNGLNSLKYTLLSKNRMPLYTNITVDIGRVEF